MTTDKKFKARVRERMAATGENYATARTALVQIHGARKVPAPPSRVFRAAPFEAPARKPERR